MLVLENTSIYFSVELSLRGTSYVMCTRMTMCSFERAHDAKILWSRDVQCNTEESP